MFTDSNLFFVLQHIFKMEQEEYMNEGVDWNEIKFVDNQPLLVRVSFLLGSRHCSEALAL
jgi:hypothetical protein